MKRAAILTLAVLFVLFVGAALAFAVFQPIKVLPRIRLAPGFAMTDQSGARLTNESLRGSIVVYNYIYTGCGQGCAKSMQTLGEVQSALAGLNTGGIPVKLVSIALDPANDTSPAMSAYAQAYQANPSVWRIATLTDTTPVGSSDRLYRVRCTGAFGEITTESWLRPAADTAE